MLESALHPTFGQVLTNNQNNDGTDPASTSSSSASSSSLLTLSDLHDMLKYLPQNRRHLSAVRCVSKTWRYVVECAPKLPWCANGDLYIARGGQTVVYNAKRCSPEQPLVLSDGATTLTDHLSFSLHSLSPVGRKVSDFCIRVLQRNFEQCSRGLAVLHLHYATITPACFEVLGQIDTLQELQLVSCRGMTHLGEAKHCQSLMVLEATLCHLDAKPLEGLFLPKLRYLKLSRSTMLESLSGAAEETFASLRFLCVEDCAMLADDGCEEVFPWMHHIEHLDLSFTNVSNAVMSLPKEGKRRLKSLILTNTNVTSEVFDDLVPDLRVLHTLRVDHCEALGSLGFLECGGTPAEGETLDDEDHAGGFLTLEILDLSHNDSSHYDAVSALRKLTSLRLVGCHEVEADFFLSLSRLVSLDLSNSTANDSTIATIGACMKHLESLNVSSCSDVRSLSPLQHCKKLRRLFASCTRVDNRGIRSLASCEALEQLDLSGIAEEEDEYERSEELSVNHLCVLRQLQTVNVFRSNISESGFAVLRENGVEIISELIYGGEMNNERSE